MSNPIFQILIVLQRETWKRKTLFVLLYSLTSLLFLAVGWSSPRIYSSFSSIMVDKQNILRPLMEGTAVTTGIVDRAKIAEEVIFSRKSLNQVIDEMGWADQNLTPLEKEMLMDDIISATKISNSGRNLIHISYSDNSAKRAYQVTKLFTDIFIEQSLEAKQKESKDAYDFISNQVTEYHRNLQDVERRTKNFRDTNMDARPGMQREVSDRIVELRRKIETTNAQIAEADIEQQALKRQLSGEAQVTATFSRVGKYQERLGLLQGQLDNLRLSYHEDYPDIVRIKGQIDTLLKTIHQENDALTQNQSGASGISEGANNNPLYQELRSSLSRVTTNLATLKARLSESVQSLEKAEQRLMRISEVQTKLDELRRDYEVNQEIYESLLKQREKARISMNIDLEKRGLTIHVQEPPSLPVSPRGIGFSHFVLAGLVLSFAVPLGIIYLLTMVDGKIRNAEYITDTLGLKALADVPTIVSPVEYRKNVVKLLIVSSVILSSWALYGYAILLKLQG